MSPLSFTRILTQTVDKLPEGESCRRLFHQHKGGEPLPSSRVLCDVIELARSTLFPGYYGNSAAGSHTIDYHIGANVKELSNLPTKQILARLRFSDGYQCNECTELKREKAARLAAKSISKLLHLRRALVIDMEAVYSGDPATQSFSEMIFRYPATEAISSCRTVHELLESGIPLIPCITTKMAHGETGVGIRPGARIGTRLTIDHGTGVMIGVASIIGNNVKLYQRVTLGVGGFPPNADGKPIKDIPRHSIPGDNVIVYSSVTILERITTGCGATVDGNIWVTENIPAGARIVQTKVKE